MKGRERLGPAMSEKDAYNLFFYSLTIHPVKKKGKKKFNNRETHFFLQKDIFKYFRSRHNIIMRDCTCIGYPFLKTSTLGDPGRGMRCLSFLLLR